MTPQHKGTVSHTAFSMLHLDEIAAKLQHHCQILKTDLDQTVSDLRFDFVGDVVCVPETPPNTREQSPIARFQCCTLMQMVQTCKITAKLSKPKF